MGEKDAFRARRAPSRAEEAPLLPRGRRHGQNGAFFVLEGRLCWREGHRIYLEAGVEVFVFHWGCTGLGAL